jgi:molecular chaperone DnaK
VTRPANGVAVGIDLGTTSSSIAVLDDGRPMAIPTPEGAVKTPSVVAFAANGNVLTGQPAVNQVVTNADRTFRAVKRRIGTQWTTGDIDGREYLPQEICAQILIRLKHDAERYLDVPVSGAVITVPAFFDDAQRQATREAARIADIEVLRLLSEPTAAALGFRLEHQETRTLVLDLGAGTCDVSLVETGDGVVEVRAISGDNGLGGDDWDQRIVDWLARRFRNAKGVDLTADRVAVQRLREAAEKAKIELSVSTGATVTIPYVAMDRYRNPLTLEESLSRAEFEEITSDLRDRVRATVMAALEQSDWADTDKVDVLLSGSAGHMPRIQSLLREMLGGRCLSMRVAPGEIVAAGAALQAGILEGKANNVLLLDVVPHSLGVGTGTGKITKIIPRNARIPTRRSEIFTTTEDDQSRVRFKVYQGEHETAEENTLLATVDLTSIKPAPKGEAKIEMTLDVDGNGIVHVSAKDLAAGHTQSVTVTSKSSLPEHVVERLKGRARRLAARTRQRAGETG